MSLNILIAIFHGMENTNELECVVGGHVACTNYT